MNATDMKHIVVVDDEPDYAQLTANILRDAGFRVTTLSGAREASELVIRDADSVDLVITDVMMGHLSEGFDLARLLRTKPETRNIPTVIVSGVREICDVATVAGEDWYPCDVFLEKPVEPHELVETVCSILKE
jgi:CheY-like chemotaxis protein